MNPGRIGADHIAVPSPAGGTKFAGEHSMPKWLLRRIDVNLMLFDSPPERIRSLENLRDMLLPTTLSDLVIDIMMIF